jgi:hypothetical protein
MLWSMVGFTIALCLPCAHAQDRAAGGGPAASQTPTDPASLDGRSFGGVSLPLEPLDGPIAFSAMKATIWKEQGTADHPTHRFLLDGNVGMQLGLFKLVASRAVVWLQERPDEQGNTYQVFVYFDEVSTPGGDSSVGVWAKRLPMEGVLRLGSARPRLNFDVRTEGRPTDAFVSEAERAFSTYLRSLVARGAYVPGQGWTSDSHVDAAAPEVGPRVPDFAQFVERLPQGERMQPVLAETGIFAFSPGDAPRYHEGPDESLVILTGGVAIQYSQRASATEPERMLEFAADRVVIFLAPGSSPAISRIGTGEIRGIYLEGNVRADSTRGRGNRPIVGSGDERYSVRAEQMYYDIDRNRAVMLDAVFWTYDQRRGLPLYMRASVIRQESANQFSAKKARLTNTAFFTPQLSIGAQSVTITSTDRVTSAGEEVSSIHVDARDITLRAQNVPFFYVPFLRGDPTRIPLRDVRLEDSTGSGQALKLTWDAISMFGLNTPAGFGLELLTDFYLERGFGGGVNVTMNRLDRGGELFLYGLPSDDGEDVLVTGDRIKHSGDARGVFYGQYWQRLSQWWVVRLGAAGFSDPTFAGTFMRPLVRTGDEATNFVDLTRTKENTELSITGVGALNDFTPNEYLLQSQGFTVDRLPEAKYVRNADDLLEQTAPGLLSYSSEYRLGLLRIRKTQPTASELGFSRSSDSLPAFGILPDESIADRLEREGFTGERVFRFDTRHELSAQLEAGPVDVTPFTVGRLTAWDNDFDAFSPNEDDNVRLWGAIGVHLGTTIQRVNNSVESKLFDLHRMRHVIRPGVTLWHAGTSIDRTSLPVYDREVESIAEGSAVRLGVDQTWQTQRGGPGRWRSVDVFTLKSDLILVSRDVDQPSPIGRFYEDRPELSNLGNFGVLEGTWQATDATALVATTIYDFDFNQPAATVLGGIVQHNPRFTTSGEVRYINVEDATFLSVGSSYQLTTTYDLTFRSVYDTDARKFQRVSAGVTRLFPNVSFGFGVAYNEITEETGFSFNLIPKGVQGRGARLRGLGSTNENDQDSSVGG